jgi:glycosyltransferase involved in cell wall biosynthesis
MNSLISVICPTYNEEKYIAQCIESTIAQDYPLSKIELLFVDGRSSDNTRDIIIEYQKKYDFIKLLDNPHKIVPYAMNIGINQASGKFIIRIDAHATYPTYYFSELIKYIQSLNADNVGGVWNTLAANDSTECRSIAIASSHKFGVGNSQHKVGAKQIIETDTVPFGCYRRDVFNRIGLFDEELVRNQDDEFNARLINSGGKIFLIPDIVINYTARDTLKKMSTMYYQYGLFKPLVNKKLRKPATVRQFFPALFLTGLFWGAIVSFFSSLLMTIFFVIIVIYLATGISIGIEKAKQQADIKLIYYLPFTFFIIHASYGWGYIIGYYKVFCNKKINVKTNR